ncbi:MAG: TonB-dependent outer rane receptor protein [Bacteroidota bacterium]|nr:TonB-dependent outer rane receptor protein [Bacteroidota bacterium]
MLNCIFAIMLHKLILTFLILLSISHLFADTCDLKISGRILDQHDNSALDYATVYIMELQQGTSADSNGSYELKNICAGTYSFIIEHLACAPDTVVFALNKSITKNFYLEHHTHELAEIITLGTRLDKENTQTTAVIDNKTLTKMEGKDLGNILSTISGVNQLKTGTTISKPIIHGLYGDRISIVNNGVKLETQDWGSEHAPEIDPFASNTIKVVKGAGSLEYGTDAMGGMVLMEPPILQKTKHIKANVSFIGQTNGHGITTSANFEQGFKKQFAYFIQGTYKRLGDGQAPHYNLTNTGLQEGNLSAGIGFLKNGWDVNAYYALFNQELGILKSSHIGNLTDLQNAIARDTPLVVKPFTYSIENPKQKIIHHLAKINVIKFFHNQSHIDLTYSFQFNDRREYDIRRGGRSNIPALDMHLISNNLLGTYTRLKRFGKNNASLEGKSGFDFLAKHNANNPQTGIRPLIPDYYQYGVGIFDMEKLSVKNFIVEAGGRYDYTRFLGYKFDRNNNLLKPKYNFHTYAFSLGTSWKNNTDIFQWQTNFSVSSRFPNASELFSDGLHHGIAALEFGNANLKPEKGFKWVNTFTTNYKKYFQSEITFYISRINDFIYLAPLPTPALTIRGAFPAFQYYQANARLLGLDVTVSSDPFSFLFLSLRASLVRGKNISAKDNLIYMPSDRITASFDVHHDFKKIKNLHAGLNVQHVFKQTKVPALITDFKAAPNAYTVLNSDAGFDLIMNIKHKLSFSISGENIANTTYRDYLDRFRYYADEAGWNLIFRLKYSFNN